VGRRRSRLLHQREHHVGGSTCGPLGRHGNTHHQLLEVRLLGLSRQRPRGTSRPSQVCPHLREVPGNYLKVNRVVRDLPGRTSRRRWSFMPTVLPFGDLEGASSCSTYTWAILGTCPNQPGKPVDSCWLSNSRCCCLQIPESLAPGQSGPCLVTAWAADGARSSKYVVHSFGELDGLIPAHTHE
jgi:hypothetical protein